MGNEQHRIGDAVRQFVVQDAELALLPVLDRDHSVEQIAQQAKLNATDATDRIQG